MVFQGGGKDTLSAPSPSRLGCLPRPWGLPAAFGLSSIPPEAAETYSESYSVPEVTSLGQLYLHEAEVGGLLGNLLSSLPPPFLLPEEHEFLPKQVVSVSSCYKPEGLGTANWILFLNLKEKK